MIDIVELCNNWNINNQANFKEIVAMYLESTCNGQLIIADKFEVIPITVYRWSTGQARPLPGMQRIVVNWIKEQVNT